MKPSVTKRSARGITKPVLFIILAGMITVFSLAGCTEKPTDTSVLTENQTTTPIMTTTQEPVTPENQVPAETVTPTPEPTDNQTSNITPSLTPTPVLFTITNSTFHDYNGNGIQDPGEPPIEGIKLTYQPGDISCTTDKDGKCTVNIPAGSYKLSVNEPSQKYRYILPSVSEVIAIEDGLKVTVDKNGEVPVPIAEGFLTLPISSNQTFSPDRYYDWSPNTPYKYLWWNGSNGNDIYPDDHIGVFDLPLNIGIDVLAAAPGVVLAYGETATSRYLIIKHQFSDSVVYMTNYGHLSEILVKIGQKVNRGDIIAKSGNTFNQYPHLHFDLFYGSNILIDAYKPSDKIKSKGYYINKSEKWEWENTDDMFPNGIGFWTKENDPQYP